MDVLEYRARNPHVGIARDAIASIDTVPLTKAEAAASRAVVAVLDAGRFVAHPTDAAARAALAAAADATATASLRDVALWAYRLGFGRRWYTRKLDRRQWTFTSPRARGIINVTHEPHRPHPWTVIISVGLEQVELVNLAPARILAAARLLGVDTPARERA